MNAGVWTFTDGDIDIAMENFGTEVMANNDDEDEGDVPALPALPDVIEGAEGLTLVLAAKSYAYTLD